MKAGELSTEFLNTYRDILTDIFVAENHVEDVSKKDVKDAWNRRVNFLQGLYSEYGLDWDKEIYVSEVTGTIFYDDE